MIATERAEARGVPLTTAWIGGLFGFFFHPGPVTDFTSAKQAHEARFKKFFAAMLEAGVYLAPSPFECGFASLAHRPADLTETLEAADRALQRAARVR